MPNSQGPAMGNRWRIMIAGLALLLVFVGAAVWWWQSGDSADDGPKEVRGENWCDGEVWSPTDEWHDVLYVQSRDDPDYKAVDDLEPGFVPPFRQSSPCVLSYFGSHDPEEMAHREEKLGESLSAAAYLAFGPEPLVATMGYASTSPDPQMWMAVEEEMVSDDYSEAFAVWRDTLRLGADPDQEFYVSDAWLEQLVGVGHTKLWFDDGSENGRTDYGWQVFTPILRDGDYSTHFLTTIATDVIEMDEDTNWTVNADTTDNPYDAEHPSSLDPVDPLLDALKNNPEAAQQVADATGDARVADLVES